MKFLSKSPFIILSRTVDIDNFCRYINIPHESVLRVLDRPGKTMTQEEINYLKTIFVEEFKFVETGYKGYLKYNSNSKPQEISFDI